MSKARKMGWMRVSLLVFLCGISVMACGRGQTDVTIVDGMTKTVFAAASGMTVEGLLSEAEISLGEEDEVTPSLDTKIEEDSVTISVKRHVRASVAADDATVEVELTGGTVADALEQAGITLGAEDFIDHSTEAYLTEGMVISVVRRAEVTLVADGETRTCITESKNVGDFLEEQQIALGEDDRVTPATDASLKDGSRVVVKRVVVKEETVTEEIAFDTKQSYSEQMAAGTKKVTQQGVNGEKEITYRVTYVDGAEESREQISEKTVREAVSQIVVQGTKSEEQAAEEKTTDGRTVVSKKRVDDCDGSGHGYFVITYSDGTVEYEEY
jgi:uncharacterized protein YabE (DUF348 family)